MSTAASPSTSGRLSSDVDARDVALAIQEDCTLSKVKSSDSILKEYVFESRMLKEKVETLLSKETTSHDSRVEFGLFFTSMIPSIDETMVIDFMDDSY